MPQAQMLPDVEARNLIEGFVQTTNKSATDSFHYMLSNRRRIVGAMGSNTFHEMLLNYRTYYKRNQKQKIVDRYKKYIMTKTNHHTSDFVIGRNILTFLWLDPVNEKEIVDFLFVNLSPRFEKKSLARLPNMRKKIVTEYIEQHMMKRK